MSRPLRIQFPGALYHVTSRGNRKGSIFSDDRDRAAFLDILGDVVRRYRWMCHAYCLMGNHYHLLIETPEPNLSAGMRQLNGVYTQWYNAVHQTVGHVFQGRFKAVIVEKEAHLLEVCRYIVLNPVRAGLASHPREWRWSSYAATAGLCKGMPWLTMNWLLTQFGAKRHEARKSYRQFVREGCGLASPLEGLAGGFILGSEAFVSLCRTMLDGDKSLDDVPRTQQHVGRPPLSIIFADVTKGDRAARNQAIAKAFLDYGYSQKAIGDYCGLHYATVSRLLKHLAKTPHNTRYKT